MNHRVQPHGLKECSPDSLYGAITRREMQLESRGLQEIAFGFVHTCEYVLRHARNRTIIDAETHRLASLAILDLTSPNTEGHIAVRFVDEPNAPLHQVHVARTTNPTHQNETYTGVMISLNVSHDPIRFWAYRTPPEELITSGIEILSSATRVVAQEIYANPINVLYRSDMKCNGILIAYE